MDHFREIQWTTFPDDFRAELIVQFLSFLLSEALGDFGIAARVAIKESFAGIIAL
jgi:hypothetical protein